MTNEKQMKAWRHDIHAHPETGFSETRTAEKVAALLAQFGLQVEPNVGGTGVVGTLQRGQGNRAIGLRADMDSLPIQEANDLAYRSTVAGAFHGCGHDGHTAMLLGAAQQLATDDHFDGCVYFIFQPSEENGRGALAMINDGLFERFPMQAVYGLHNMPGTPTGHFAVREGAIMTSEDIFEITINGRGGHASMPDRVSDPVIIAAEVIQAMQTIVSRSIGPKDWGVVSVTEILTDGARNVIPSTVTIKGDSRSLSANIQGLIEKRMRQIVDGIALAHDVSASVDYRQDFIVTNNASDETRHVVAAAQALVGIDAVDSHCDICGGSEDFARMLQHVPGCFAFIGNGTEGAHGASLHNPSYDFNDALLPIGRDYWVTLVRQQLPESS